MRNVAYPKALSSDLLNSKASIDHHPKIQCIIWSRLFTLAHSGLKKVTFFMHSVRSGALVLKQNSSQL